MTRLIQSLPEISTNYDALFVDLWGCVHNGVTAYPEACAALQAYRQTGGKVVLVTNSPRPWRSVATQIKEFGVPDDAYDAIATSGDSARLAMYLGVVGQKVHHIGDMFKDDFMQPMDIIMEEALEITEVPLKDAEGIVCSGPEDPLADPEEYRGTFLYAKQKGMKLLCANPDIVVDRGEIREWCAGALAALYTEMGGESLYFGKPHPPIYDLARRRLSRIAEVEDARILCIGDGIGTDVMGGIGEGLDVLFITGGLAAKEFGPDPINPDPARLKMWLSEQNLAPTAAISLLR
ncbi:MULTISPECIES: TIGR01459 family HAD-type hydrolase [Roseobacteraceae]|uniref:HAD family hydrolase n=1 Tax=Celeribacter baekdonensis B30 TaxID=1208323 RepID=K2JWV6_9RHOB|nr:MULTISPECIES: TIGR01459 family HAD-type hydrolase [Roseobacteraceae]EKE69665.1 HAD family hydrolase [Celeribacter baekdonensis B30]KAB6714213.1 TIGR01459 family HAD-type hydrolase [Roseobacter sp. TSBP12]|tara:strand:+ start:43431 stop:44306 length:876 start_codon:yes stop_codon:yes gene_type:complete